MAAQSIDFVLNDLDKAKSLSIAKNKALFIDTNASWCTQCKKMDRIFQDPEVGAFFNKHFVNVKIDMGTSQYAVDIKRDYDVIFLPTMIILDVEGRVKYMVDRVLSKSELLEVARKVATPGVYLENDVVAINETPIDDSEYNGDTYVREVKTVQTDIEEIEKSPESNVVEDIPLPKRDDSNDKILYVLKDQVELPAAVLHEEAYYRMTLMDGSQTKAAKKYLKTQDDWSTEKNMKFINDFTVTTDSDMFRFMIENRAKFEELLGKDHVSRTVEILVYRKLYQGIPRPDYDESQRLLSYINPEKSKIETLRYYLERMYQEQNFDEYIKFAPEYLISVNANDDKVYYRLAEIGFKKEQSLDETNISLDQINKAIHINDKDPQYYYVKAALLLKKGDKPNALKAANKCVKANIKKGHSLTDINELISQIKRA